MNHHQPVLLHILATTMLIFPETVLAQNVAKDNSHRVVRIEVSGTDAGGLTRKQFGSGFFVHPDGYILTVLHVVEKESYWKVVNGKIDRQIMLTWSDLSGGLKQEGRVVVVYYDPLIDLALLRIPQSSLPSVTLGDSRKVSMNDKVTALGYPAGANQPTPVQGTIQLQFDSVYGGFLKFSGTVDTGNSGSPLFNEDGVVIGVVNAGLPYGLNVGFAIPINLASGIIAKINRPPKFDQ